MVAFGLPIAVTIDSSQILDIRNQLVLVDSSSGNITVQLPNIVSFFGSRSATQAFCFEIKKISAANTVTIESSVPGVLIDGAASISLTALYEAVKLEFDGYNWYILADSGNVPIPFIASVSDTNTVDLTVTGTTLSADVNYQNTATINLSEDASGLKADFASMDISQFTGVLTETHGGTNQNTYTTGDILYASNTNVLSKLPIGSESDVLTVSNGVPAYLPAVNPSRRLVWYQEFMGVLNASVASQATYFDKDFFAQGLSDTAVNISTNSLVLSTGTSSTGAVYAGSRQVYLGLGEVKYEAVVKIPVLSVLAQRFYVRIGLFNTRTVAGNTNGIWFEYKDDVNSGNWTINTMSASAPTSANTSTAPVADTYARYTIIINAANTLATFYIDGVSVGSISTTLPASLTSSALIGIEKTAGGTARTIQADYMYLSITFTTPR